MTEPRHNEARRWLPRRAFLVRGAVLSFVVGMLIGLLLSAGSADEPLFDLAELGWSGLVGLLIFSFSVLGICAGLPIFDRWGRAARTAAIATTFLVAGAVSWTVVQVLLFFVYGQNVFSEWALARVAVPVAITALLALIIGSGFYLYERLKEELSESVSRLKEAEFAERELEIARSIQSRLLPPTELAGDGYRVAARNLPAQYVAGDFYDVFALADGGLGLAVADVSGKGIGTGLIMASVKSVLPLLAAAESVETTLARLNRKLRGELEARQFVALCLVRFDPVQGEVTLANAGLPDPYLLRPGAAAEALTVPGSHLPLGVRDGDEYCALRLRLAPGDRLLLLTDGLPEALTPAGDPLGYEALPRLFPTDELSPAAWLDRLLAEVRRATGAELDDDWTALLLERRVGPDRSANAAPSDLNRLDESDENSRE